MRLQHLAGVGAVEGVGEQTAPPAEAAVPVAVAEAEAAEMEVLPRKDARNAGLELGGVGVEMEARTLPMC